MATATADELTPERFTRPCQVPGEYWGVQVPIELRQDWRSPQAKAWRWGVECTVTAAYAAKLERQG